MKGNKPKTLEENQNIQMLMDERKINSLEDINKIIGKLNEIAKIYGLSNIQKFLILFYSHYNHFNPQAQCSSKLIQLSEIMLKKITKKNILFLVQEAITKLFPEENIFGDKKDINFEDIGFALCKLSKNVDILETFFTSFLNIIIFNTNEYHSLNLENPITLDLFEIIFDSIYGPKKDDKKAVEEIIKNCIEKSNSCYNNLFRCKLCYDIMIIKLNNNNNIEVKCQNCDKQYEEINEIDALKTFYTKIFCIQCKEQIFLYKQNFKCVTCKNLVCLNCKIKHFHECFSLNYINLFEVGYKCELHNKFYTDYCFACKKNLCEYCKQVHFHKITEMPNINNTIKEFLKNKTIYRLSNVKNELIKYNLSQIYLDNKKRNIINGFIFEFTCKLFQIDLKNTMKNIIFKKFNNDEFRDYYDKLLHKVSQGSQYHLYCLKLIKSKYKKKDINLFEINYESLFTREKEIQNFIDRSKYFFKFLQQLHRNIKNDLRINNLKIKNDTLKINIEELRMQLLLYKNAKKNNQENTHNILSGFLADELLNIIIEKYKDKLEKVSLTLYIFLDLIVNGYYNILSNKEIIGSIENISNELSQMIKELKEKPNDENIKEKLIKFVHGSYKLRFIEDVIIGNELFKKEDLNIILDILFFIKNVGNKTAHPNIDIKNSIKIINIKNLPIKFEIEYFFETELKAKIGIEIIKKREKKDFQMIIKCPQLIANSIIDENEIDDYVEEEDKDMYYNSKKYKFNYFDDFNLFKNLEDYRIEVKNKIKEKIIKIRDEFLSSFNECKMKKNINIEEIIEVIFSGKDEIIFNETKNLVRLLNIEKDNVINKYLNLNLEEYLCIENEDIDSLREHLNSIKLILKNFWALKIPKHNNLDEYINIFIESQKVNYSKYISFIENLESFKFDKNRLDCLRNEIIAEICFLLLNKVFVIEIERLELIIKNYEEEIMKNIIYEEIAEKLKEISKIFENRFSNNSIELTVLIQKYLSDLKKVNNLDLEQIKIILIKIIK